MRSWNESGALHGPSVIENKVNNCAKSYQFFHEFHVHINEYWLSALWLIILFIDRFTMRCLTGGLLVERLT